MRKTKLFPMALSVLLALSLSVPLGACSKGSSSGDSSKKVTLTFWAGSGTENRNTFLKQTFADFEEKNPNITVTYLGVPGSASDLNQKVNMAISGNALPDVIQGFLYSSYITRSAVAPLDSYFDKSSLKKDIDSKYIDSFRAVDNKNKKLYAIPAPINVQMIYARPDLITAAGLTPKLNTWDDFFNIADKTTNAGKGVYGYIIRGGSGGAAAMEYQMYSYSGITSFFDSKGKCTINDPKNVEYLEKYIGRYKKDTSQDDLNKNWNAMESQFQSGKAVMLVHNTGSGPDIYKSFNNDATKVAALTYPKSSYTNKVTVPQPTLNGYMIMKSSKNKDAAWKLVEYMQSASVAGQYAKIFGQLPVTKSALSESWIQESPYMKAAADCMNSKDTVLTIYPNYLPDFSAIENDETTELQKVILGKETAQQMLDDWAKKLQDDYDKSQKS